MATTVEAIQARLSTYVEENDLLNPEFQQWLKDHNILKTYTGYDQEPPYQMALFFEGSLPRWEILYTVLRSHPGSLHSYDKLAAVAGIKGKTTPAVQVYIDRLRKRLHQQKINPKWVHSKYTLGYGWGIKELKPQPNELDYLRLISGIPFKSVPRLVQKLDLRQPYSVQSLLKRLSSYGLPRDHKLSADVFKKEFAMEKIKECQAQL